MYGANNTPSTAASLGSSDERVAIPLAGGTGTPASDHCHDELLCPIAVAVIAAAVLPPPCLLLLLFDAPMGFRFRRARNTGKTASCVAPPPSTSPPSLRNKRAWLSTNSLILSKDAHRADHGGLPFLSSGLTSSPLASLQSTSVQSLLSRSPPPPPPRNNVVACHPQLAVQCQERAWSSPTLQ